VSVPEQAGKIMEVLKLLGAEKWLSFSALTRDCTLSMQVVGRFLALLELYKAKAVETEYEDPLGTLSVSWTGLDVDPAVVSAADWDEGKQTWCRWTDQLMTCPLSVLCAHKLSRSYWSSTRQLKPRPLPGP